MKIFLIRHGETTGDVEGKYGGDYDDHLSPKGRAESEELAQKLKNKSIEVIFHSPKIRAVETATILNSALGVKLERIEDLRERNNYGILTGLTKAEATARYPREVEKLAGGAYRHSVKGSEDYEHFKIRIADAFGSITRDDRFHTIAVVTHGGPIRCILREIIKAGELKELRDCAFFEIEREGGKYRLVAINNAKLEE